MKRGEFVEKSFGAAALFVATNCIKQKENQSVVPSPEQPKKAAALQLYTVRTLLEKDFEGTIAGVARIGYTEVELHDLFGRTATQVRAVLDGEGLTAPARHVGLTGLRDRIDEVVDDSLALGCKWIVCPFVGQSERSLDGYRKVADDLNAAALALSSAGLAFAYHNHDFEFSPVDDTIPYDLLLERCDDDLVGMELDLYWITKGGSDPLAYFDHYPGRFPLCHVKDMGTDGSMADVGSGIIDFATIFSASEQAGFKHYFVEHDEPPDPIASVTTSYSGLTSLFASY